MVDSKLLLKKLNSLEELKKTKKNKLKHDEFALNNSLY